MDCAREWSASNWLSALPIKSKRFYLNKQEFWDALDLRHGFELKRVPNSCVCVAKLSHLSMHFLVPRVDSYRCGIMS